MNAERDNRRRMSQAPSPDRRDAEIMQHLTRAMRDTRPAQRMAVRRRAMSAWDLVTVRNPSNLRWAR